MNPAFSVIIFTTLAGTSQGLFLALFAVEMSGFAAQRLIVWGASTSWVLAIAGLAATFFHLGHPQRAWRAALMWRTSWLSREVIALPVFIVAVGLWGAAHLWGWGHTAWWGAVAAVACVALFLCTAMIYVSIRFLQEWASPLTVLNYTLMGCASGWTLASVLASLLAPAWALPLSAAALLWTLAAAAGRWASLRRNARLKPRSTVQSAIGVHHGKVVQRSMGFGGGSYNTREFFHGKTAAFLRSVKWWFLLLAFVVPGILLALAPATLPWLLLAFALQYVGLLAERWFFFAQANHPQNIYYQVVS
jgi:DMSO reductase anchor subunit